MQVRRDPVLFCTDVVDFPSQLTLVKWICQLCSMTNTSEKYVRTQQGNLLALMLNQRSPKLYIWRRIWPPVTFKNNSRNAEFLFLFLKGEVSFQILIPFYRTWARSLATLVTNWLTHSCLVHLINVTLAWEDANSKLSEVVTIADVDAERGVERQFGADLEAEVWS